MLGLAQGIKRLQRAKPISSAELEIQAALALMQLTTTLQGLPHQYV